MKYSVIGGQYRFINYGSFPTIRDAKICAMDHEEYWDNWEGWHTPAVYLTSTLTDGYPTERSECVAQRVGKRWVNPSKML